MGQERVGDVGIKVFLGPPIPVLLSPQDTPGCLRPWVPRGRPRPSDDAETDLVNTSDPGLMFNSGEW